MAIAFVLRHPAISSAIIGPRTMEHLNPADNGWVSPALEASVRRR